MTPTELRELIASDADAAKLAAVGDDTGCAKRLKEIAPQIPATSRRMTFLSMAASLPPDTTRALIVAVRKAAEVDPLVDEMLRFLRGSGDGQGVDVAHATTVAVVEGFVGAGWLTADQAEAIATLGLQSQTITPDEVSAAMSPDRPGKGGE